MQLMHRERASSGRLMPRARAFEMQGVTLKYPSRSWSGVRYDDGAVVLAVQAREVQVDAHGCNVLLWTPRAHAGPGGADRASRAERLEHCRLALRRGHAEGLIAHGDAAEMDPNVIVTLRVVVLGTEYWGRWRAQRSVVAARHPKHFPSSEARLAA